MYKVTAVLYNAQTLIYLQNITDRERHYTGNIANCITLGRIHGAIVAATVRAIVVATGIQHTSEPGIQAELELAEKNHGSQVGGGHEEWNVEKGSPSHWR